MLGLKIFLFSTNLYTMRILRNVHHLHFLVCFFLQRFLLFAYILAFVWHRHASFLDLCFVFGHKSMIQTELIHKISILNKEMRRTFQSQFTWRWGHRKMLSFRVVMMGGGVGYQTPCWQWTFAFFTPQVFFLFWAGSHPFCPPTSYATRRFPFCVLFMWQICVVFLLQLQFFTF